MRKVDPVKQEEKRQEILAAAGRCFSRDGFRGASIAGICVEAGISPGHLYYYFENKEAIVAAMTNIAMGQAVSRFTALMEGPDTIAALMSVVEAAWQRYKPEHRSVLLDVMAEAGRNPAIAATLQTHSRSLHDLVAGLLRAGQGRGQVDPGLDTDMAARLVMGLVDAPKTMMTRDPDFDPQAGLAMTRTLIGRFLTPPAKAGLH
ncbi:MAG: TetR/AcrR family transcriptional regulator [Azospirillaceae bacterium]|nr:TetR/AcrR family transcriptional regulator [Azospirillaceae bacterium]